MRIEAEPNFVEHMSWREVERRIEAGAAAFGRDVSDFLYETDIIRFSNTIGTNTIIQRNGAKIGLLVTAGQAARQVARPRLLAVFLV